MFELALHYQFPKNVFFHLVIIQGTAKKTYALLQGTASER
jgi:hypothetical protein